MATTFITNIRYGNLPVRKVYLGEKLVWQCVDVQGQSESASYANGKTIVLELIPIVGDAESKTFSSSITRALEITLMNGISENVADTNAICKVFAVILMNGYESSESNGVANAKVFNAISANSKTFTQSEMHGFGDFYYVADMSSDARSEFFINAKGNSFNIAEFVGHNHSSSNAKGTMDFVVKIGISAKATSKTYASAIANVLNLVLMNGKMNSVTNTTDGICRLFILLQANGESESSSYDDAIITFNPVFPIGASNSESMSFYISNGIVCNTSNGNCCQYSNSDIEANAVLWYPPIGDGEVLFGDEDLITRNGDILEIRQVYQINIDEENKTMEVI